jgi:hypothetical protein
MKKVKNQEKNFGLQMRKIFKTFKNVLKVLRIQKLKFELKSLQK